MVEVKVDDKNLTEPHKNATTKKKAKEEEGIFELPRRHERG